MHIISELKVNNLEKLRDLDSFNESLNKILASAGVSNLGSTQHKFENSGFTLTVCLAESHIAVHTWPEFKYVTLDVYLCNFLHDNTQKCEDIHLGISQYFSPASSNTIRLIR